MAQEVAIKEADINVTAEERHVALSPVNEFKDALIAPKLLDSREISSIISAADTWQPTSVTGMRGNYKPGDRPFSFRYNFHDQKLADTMFSRIADEVSDAYIFNPGHFMDRNGRYQAVGISPVFRVIRYPEGGYLVPHYDAPFADNRGVTLLSVVVSLDNSGYPTRFLADDQKHVPVVDRDLRDKHIYDKFDILATPETTTGDALIFPHRRLHDTTPVTIGGKMIMRTDLIFQEV